MEWLKRRAAAADEGDGGAGVGQCWIAPLGEYGEMFGAECGGAGGR